MSDDLIDLPTRRRDSLPTSIDSHNNRGISLSEEQVGQLVNTGSKVAEGVMIIAHDLVDIARIRAQSSSEVDVIQARSQALVAELRAEIDRVMREQESVRTRTEAAVTIIQAVMNCIPETDHSSRAAAIDNLNELVRTVLVNDMRSSS